MIDQEHEALRAEALQLADHEELGGRVERRERLVEEEERRARRAEEHRSDQRELHALPAAQLAAEVVLLDEERLAERRRLVVGHQPQLARQPEEARRQRRLRLLRRGAALDGDAFREPLDRPRVQRAVGLLRELDNAAVAHAAWQPQRVDAVKFNVGRRRLPPCARAQQAEERRLAHAVRTFDGVRARRRQRDVGERHARRASRVLEREQRAAAAVAIGRGAERRARVGGGEGVVERGEAVGVGVQPRELRLGARAHQQRVDRVLDHPRVDPNVGELDVAAREQQREAALDGWL